MENPVHDIELLIARCEQMRLAQSEYFRFRKDSYKRAAMGLEKGLDDLLKHLRKKGYNPDRFKVQGKENKLF